MKATTDTDGACKIELNKNEYELCIQNNAARIPRSHQDAIDQLKVTPT